MPDRNQRQFDCDSLTCISSTACIRYFQEFSEEESTWHNFRIQCKTQAIAENVKSKQEPRAGCGVALIEESKAITFVSSHFGPRIRLAARESVRSLSKPSDAGRPCRAHAKTAKLGRK